MSNNNNNGASTTDGKNIIVGPDYGQMARESTNSAIIGHFLTYLFAGNVNIKILVRNLMIALVVKTTLEESKGYLDGFKFTNMDYVRYAYQCLRHSEKKYELTLSETTKKWSYDNKNINANTFTPFLESKSIYISQPNTYYYTYFSQIIKVLITNNKIIFHLPNLTSMSKYMDETLDKHQEILLGNRTAMSRATLNNSSDIMQFNPMPLIYAFETDNYTKLYDSLVSTFMVDSMLKIRQTPLSISFDGEPGTGKTTFGSYIAEKGIFDRIILYNMLQGVNLDFKAMLVSLERIIVQQAPKDRKADGEQEIILLIFDEVDKWLDSYINNKIDSFRSESRTKKEMKPGSGTEAVVLESFVKLTVEEEDDKKKQLRLDFLDKLYNLIDGQTLKNDRKYVIIFNTNHFDKMFEGAGPKYDATMDRFQRYTFKKINKVGIVKYVDGIKKKLANITTDSTIPVDKKKIYLEHIDRITNFDETIYDSIPNDFEISYRNLSKILIDNCFDIPKSLKFLSNNNKDQFEVVINI